MKYINKILYKAQCTCTHAGLKSASCKLYWMLNLDASHRSTLSSEHSTRLSYRVKICGREGNGYFTNDHTPKTLNPTNTDLIYIR
jgi:hypothetical protein